MRIGIPKKETFKMTLEENAGSSLAQGIHHFIQDPCTNNDLKFAVLHVFHAVELFLKARLSEEHPLLIYSRPEKPVTTNSHTVCFEDLVGRLKNAGVNLSMHLGDLKRLKAIRNAVEHHRVDTQENVKNYVGSAAKFLDKFLKEELDIELESLLDNQKYTALSDAIHSYDERLEKAKQKFHDALPDGKRGLDITIDNCPECGEETLSPDLSNDGVVECFFCHEKFHWQSCPRCNQTIYSQEQFDEDNDPGVCDDCWDNVK